MRKYSDSPHGRAPSSSDLSDRPILAIDSGSTRVSLAIGLGDVLLAEDAFPGGPASPPLLERVDSLLHAAGLQISDLGGLIGSQGPGSFTGLRTGLATLLGLHQALRIPATAVASFRPLALQAEPTHGSAAGEIIAAIDALRGEWYVQRFRPDGHEAAALPTILPATALMDSRPDAIVAFGSERLREAFPSAQSVRIIEARPLAPFLLRLAHSPHLEWQAGLLTLPLYLRPPAVTAKAPRPGQVPG